MSIYESWPWRTELRRDAKLLRKWSTQPICNDRRAFNYEKKIFFAAYSIRKLLDSRKLRSSFERSSIAVETYPLIALPKGWHPRDVWFESYDLTNAQSTQLNVRVAINVLIHSEVFVLNCDEFDSVDGFLFNSDKSVQFLYSLSINRWAELMEAAADSAPQRINRELDPIKNELIETRD